MFDPTQPAQQTRPTTTSVARPNKKCWTVHNWAEAPYWAQCYSLKNWISHWCKFWVLIGQFWCNIDWILQARATNAFFIWFYTGYSILVHWKDTTQVCTTVVWLTGVQGCEPPPWQDKCRNWDPFCLYFGIRVLFWFLVICCDFAFFASSWTVILQWFWVLSI